MSLMLVGIANCDTVRAARRWLDQEKIPYTFRDFRKQPLTDEEIAGWLEDLGPEAMINRRSTTWRNLSDDERAMIAEGSVADVIVRHPTLIKRPLWVRNGTCLQAGFRPSDPPQLSLP
jgi:arsenate reductase